MSQRDTQFRGAANALYQRIARLFHGYTVISEDLNDREKEEIIQLISQYSYDIVQHTCEYMRATYATDIPDLLEWSKGSDDE